MRTLLIHADQVGMRRTYIRHENGAALLKATRTVHAGTARQRRSNYEYFFRLVMAMLFVFVLGVWSAVAQQPGAITIQGKVSDASGAPINKAAVRLERVGGPSAETTTNADGSFTFRALPPGDYRIVLRVNGQQAVTSPTVAWK